MSCLYSWPTQTVCPSTPLLGLEKVCGHQPAACGALGLRMVSLEELRLGKALLVAPPRKYSEVRDHTVLKPSKGGLGETCANYCGFALCKYLKGVCNKEGARFRSDIRKNFFTWCTLHCTRSCFQPCLLKMRLFFQLVLSWVPSTCPLAT